MLSQKPIKDRAVMRGALRSSRGQWRAALAVVVAVMVTGALQRVCAAEGAEHTANAAGLVDAGMPAPAFSGRFILSTHDGRTVTDDEFRGRHLLVFFGYTHCPDVCPTSLLTLASVLERLGADAAHVQPLFITVDPERDTRDVLAAFVNHFDERIIGLTGSPAMIERVAKGFRVKFAKVAASEGYYSVDHTAAMFHVGPMGQLLGRFNYETTAEEIAAALRAAIASE